ncbi:MAG: 2-C-methyl-D-erythritol 2,4-cyclodiphosphate synthase [Sulfobacillus acidophilus]|uniref:2-C-methyl-D-erythritol 2,4-cyclodiphosphate synthase n=1 Tax=Sulfobacillus acidophilus TaxID=53633 RepID=A0A2T2WIF6_9FIRM|nr:MAG: 2-C-methyl-D-erythritol 2,4-cyclodiphosphate synthase [Sulfobacillus acidophilus]
MRMGQGFDAHPLVVGRPLILGGIRVDYPRGLQGDSDGDVLTHAIIDAILGAMGAGDIGTWFRGDDPTVRGAASTDLLRRVMQMTAVRRCRVEFVDATVIGEEPKVRPLVPDIRNVLAPILRIQPDSISIKATTTDQMGWLGRKEGLAALALVQLAPVNDANSE